MVLRAAYLYTIWLCLPTARHIVHCAMDRKPNRTDQAERSRRWREGVKQRLDQIQAELRAIGAGIDQQLVALTERLGEDERGAGRRQ